MDCNVCEQVAQFTCSRCLTARYCSKRCQIEDWSHDQDPHSAWCFDYHKPDVDHIANLIDACLIRAHGEEENEDSDDEYEEEEDIPNDIEGQLIWLRTELEDPFDLHQHLIGATPGEKALERKERRGGEIQGRGRVRRKQALRKFGQGKILKGAKEFGKATEEIHRGKGKEMRSKRKVKKKRKRRKKKKKKKRRRR